MYKYKKKKKIIIEVDTSEALNQRGPANFFKGINDILPYNSRNCTFISSKKINPVKRNTKTNFYFIPFPQFDELIFNQW